MTTKQRFDEKDPISDLILTYDFTQGLAPTETLAGVPVISVVVVYGTDINANAILNGSPSFDATNKLVFVPVQGGLDGVDYDIVLDVQTTNPQKLLVMGCILPVRVQ